MKKEKVMVAMSGGVDSAMTAVLLLKQGYQVTGLTMDTGDHRVVEEAKALADTLGIPHLYLDVSEEFRQQVVENFLTEYQQGRTPNPCVFCNKRIKLGRLFDFALEQGADYLATGHYAKIKEQNGRYLLYRSDYTPKDQSYVLYSLSQRVLSRLLLPLAGYAKEQVRAQAASLGLAVASKPDSQDICFIPDGDYRGFLDRHGVRCQPGNFVDTQGNVLGRHQGIINYTVGQRKGLGLALGYPAYVVAIDVPHNQVVIGREKELYRTTLIARECNFIPFDCLQQPLPATIRVRYQSQGTQGMLYPMGDGAVKVVFDQPEKSITPGQSGVFYQRDMVLGGGVIE